VRAGKREGRERKVGRVVNERVRAEDWIGVSFANSTKMDGMGPRS